jgi:hypothetical protein
VRSVSAARQYASVWRIEISTQNAMLATAARGIPSCADGPAASVLSMACAGAACFPPHQNGYVARQPPFGFALWWAVRAAPLSSRMLDEGAGVRSSKRGERQNLAQQTQPACKKAAEKEGEKEIGKEAGEVADEVAGGLWGRMPA